MKLLNDASNIVGEIYFNTSSNFTAQDVNLLLQSKLKANDSLFSKASVQGD